MSEIRHDPLTNQWVVIAPERLNRPGVSHLSQNDRDDEREYCPFCEGNEAMTPSEIVALRANGHNNGPGWTTRVVPNRFPALRVEPQMKKMGAGLYNWVAGVGAHEVIIESAEHIICSWDLRLEQYVDAFRIIQQRIADLRKDFRLLSLVYFKNQGELAGATVAHTHAQLLALPIIAPQLDVRVQNGFKYERFHGRCGFCDRLNQEVQGEERLIWTGKKIMAFAPYASLFPFQTLFQSKDHEPCFERASSETLLELATALLGVLNRMKDILERPAVQWILYTAPLQDRKWDSFFDWHIELRPIIYPLGGVEWGSGITINPVTPEMAATQLRC